MADLAALLNQTFTLAAPIQWVGDEDELVSVSALESGGATVQGLQLRMKTKRAQPDKSVMFQLEFQDVTASKPEPVARICWRPFHTHNNKNRGPAAYRLLLQRASHHHTFADNWDAANKRMSGKNLPIAIPIAPDPKDYGGLLAFVSIEFRISDLDTVPVPPWEAALT